MHSKSPIIKIVSKDQPTPKRWKKFLGSSSYKNNLIEFLLETWKTFDFKFVVNFLHLYITSGSKCFVFKLCNGSVAVESVECLYCDHEEADTHFWLHAAHANHNYDNVMVKSPDTDVAIIGISVREKLVGNIFFNTGVKQNQRIMEGCLIQFHTKLLVPVLVCMFLPDVHNQCIL